MANLLTTASGLCPSTAHPWLVRVRAGLVSALLGLLPACGPSAPDAKSTLHSQSESWPLAAKELRADLGSAPRQVTPGPLVQALEREIARVFPVLSGQPDPVYYLSYQVTDEESYSLASSDNASLYERRDKQRALDVDLRIGSHERDHTHRLPGESNDSTYHGMRLLPLDSEGQPLLDALWLATDDEYEAARQQWMRVLASEQRSSQDVRNADFSKEPAVVSIGPRARLELDTAAWSERLRQISGLARAYPDIMNSSVSLDAIAQTRTFASSEGSRIQGGRVQVRFSVEASTLSLDGMPLARFDTIDVDSVGSLPGEAALRARFKQVLDEVRALRDAPLIEPYAGPAILDGRAAGVFFHEIFGHRIEGHRQDDKTEGQTFASLVGKQVLSSNLSIYDDPRLVRLNGVDLNGHYHYDDEGVQAARANLVEAGILRGFLMSRAPARSFNRSNGHGRRQQGHAVVARQANLVVEPTTAVSPQTLKQALLVEVKRQGLPYGLRFSEITGGFTQTGRGDTQAFKVMPVMVYRVYPDGREELVRGVDMEGTPLTALSKILLAANDFQTFNGVCGAESGWVPVSATSPSLLVSQIEVARQEQSELRPPVLPWPTLTQPRPGASAP
jgi:TldD protein